MLESAKVMFASPRRSLLCASLAVILALQQGDAADAPVEPAAVLQAKLADPAFRLRAEQPGGGRRFAMSALTDQTRPAAYEWLRGAAKPVREQALECRLLAWLARELKRPADEVLKADDLVLQAAPDLPEGWLNRAEFYAAAPEPEKAAWALDMAAHALRRLNLATHDWRGWLGDTDLAAWRERAVKAGKAVVLVEALSDALGNTTRGEARLDAAALLLDFLRDKLMQEHPETAEKLLDAMATAQPHLALGDVPAFAELARSFETAGQPGVASRLAQLLILAPVPRELAAVDEPGAPGFAIRWQADHPAPQLAENASELDKARFEIASAQHASDLQQAVTLRGGWRTLQHGWEDTTPRYQAGTQARVLLSLAMSDDALAFTQAAVPAAEEQPWNEGLIAHALLAVALTDGLQEESLHLASALNVEQRGRLALRLCAFAPRGRLPAETLAPWLEEGALASLQTAEGQPVERAAFASVLQSMEALEGQGGSVRLARVLQAAMTKPPRALDADHWQSLAQLVLRHGAGGEVKAFAGTWNKALGNEPVEKEHLSALAAAALRGGAQRGGDFAVMLLGVWQRRFAEHSQRTAEDTVAASRVAESLLACEDMAGFTTFVTALKEAGGTARNTTFSRMVEELAALRELLTGEGDRLPAVDAWVQPSAVEGGAPRVQWQLVLPELDRFSGRVPPIRIQLLVGGREAADNMSAEETADGRWWSAGTAHPLLAKLAGRFDLEILAGETPDRLRSLATVREAGANGSVETAELPPAGCLRVMLRSRTSGAVNLGEVRPCSLRTALFSTGREPDAAPGAAAVALEWKEHPSPPTWQRRDDERWGRFIGPPIAIEEGTEYLLTDFTVPATAETKPLPVKLILLDEKQRPLGPVPLVSAGFHADAATPAIYTPHRAHTQCFRASDWGGADDLVCPREKGLSKGEQTNPARYMAFVTRSTGDGPLPLLQLRRYREPANGTEADLASDSLLTQMPELNGEFVASVGFRVRSWHITMGPERGIFTGQGRLAGFDVARIPWQPMMRVESPLLLGDEWPMCFEAARALVVEPSWSGERKLGVRFVPFGDKGKNYAACEHRELPLPTYSRGEISIHRDGALMMVSSQNRENPEPVAGWLEPDGRFHVCPLPRPPLKGNAGLEIAWWGPPAPWVTLHEDGMLFHLEHVDGLRLRKAEPGSPDDMPPDATPPKSKKKPQWRLERPDILTEHDTKTGVMVRRFHLPQPCEAKPMSFTETSPVFLFTTEHDVIRVNPPPRRRNDE